MLWRRPSMMFQAQDLNFQSAKVKRSAHHLAPAVAANDIALIPALRQAVSSRVQRCDTAHIRLVLVDQPIVFSDQWLRRVRSRSVILSKTMPEQPVSGFLLTLNFSIDSLGTRRPLRGAQTREQHLDYVLSNVRSHIQPTEETIENGSEQHLNHVCGRYTAS